MMCLGLRMSWRGARRCSGCSFGMVVGRRKFLFYEFGCWKTCGIFFLTYSSLQVSGAGESLCQVR